MIRYHFTRITDMSFLRKSPLGAIACLSILASSFALAAADEDSKMNALLECAALQDDARRLECFDNATAEPQAPAVVNEAAASPPVEAAEPASVATPATESAAEPVVEPELSPVEQIGMNAAVAARSAGSVQSDKLTEISATATHVSKRAYGELVVTLENGQVWTEKESEYGFRVKEGDTTTIRQGTFGGYRMISRGNRSSQVVRVK